MSEEPVPKPDKPAARTIKLGDEVLIKLRRMAAADYRHATNFLSMLIEEEWANRDPSTGRRLVVSAEDRVLRELSTIRARMIRTEGQVDAIQNLVAAMRPTPTTQ